VISIDNFVAEQALNQRQFAALKARDAEWRRLVEEAQGETRRVNNEAQLRLAAVGTAAEEAQAERDRAYLTSAEYLAAKNDAEAERDRLKGELAMERNAYDTTLYRLKGELAEARAMVLDACAAHASDCRCEWCAFLAATPAEQAQGEVARHSKDCAQLEEKLGGCADDCPQRAECGCTTNGVCACVAADSQAQTNAQVAALAKRVKEIESWRNSAAPPPLPDYAHHHTFRADTNPTWSEYCGARVRGGDSPFCGQVEDWYGHPKDVPAPPPPEAAGPGHAFVFGRFPDYCHAEIDGDYCKRRASHPIHAVPPIPEGAK
jgi:hypothetical protein